MNQRKVAANYKKNRFNKENMSRVSSLAGSIVRQTHFGMGERILIVWIRRVFHSFDPYVNFEIGPSPSLKFQKFTKKNFQKFTKKNFQKFTKKIYKKNHKIIKLAQIFNCILNSIIIICCKCLVNVINGSQKCKSSKKKKHIFSIFFSKFIVRKNKKI